MSKWSAMIIVAESAMEGIENYEAADIIEASRIAIQHAAMCGGRVIRVESCDFGPFEFMR